MKQWDFVSKACPGHDGAYQSALIRWTGNVPKAQRVLAILRQNIIDSAGRDPVLRLRQEIRNGMFTLSHLDTQIRIVRILRIHPNGICPVIELVDHPPLIQRQINLLVPLPTIAAYRIETCRLQLRCRSE